MLSLILHHKDIPKSTKMQYRDNIRCDLLAQIETSAFLKLLDPSMDKIKQDHSYSKPLPTPGCQVIMSTQTQKLEGAKVNRFAFFHLRR